VDSHPYRGADVARCWAGFASLGAGLVHAAVITEHWSYWLPYGVFFGVVAAAQLGWAVAALARDRIALPRLMVGANLALIALWGVTRTVGLPFGPDAGRPEAIGVADLGAVGLQLILVAVVLGSRLGVVRRLGRSTAGLLTGLAGGALVVGLITTPALAGTEAGAHAHHHGAAAEYQGARPNPS
jgi:hypothetical protein